MATKRTKRSASRKPIRRRSAAGQPWTREELAFLRKFYRNNETAWVARQLGRTVYSVRYKASDMNIKKANPSVWRGNQGVTKGKKATRRPAKRRATARRRSTTRRWASPKRRTVRKASSRRTKKTRRASSRRTSIRRASSRKVSRRRPSPRRRARR